MSSVTESNLGLNYGWAYGESGWNTGMDDNLVKLGFTSRNQVKGVLSAPPSTPSNGDAYIVGTSPTGLFSGNFGKVAIWDRTVWLFLTPKNQEVVYNVADGCDYKYDNGWVLKQEDELSPYVKVKDFTLSTGYTITDQRQCLLNLADNKYYQWFGTLPKVIPAGSTPATSGGIGPLLWVDRTDLMLRSDLNIVVKTFNTVSELKAFSALSVGQYVKTIGYNNIFDGGGNDYYIVAAGTGIDDGGTFIDLPASGFQARGLFTNNIADVKKFGAVGDGVADDTGAIQAAINSGYRSVYFPDGIYLTTAPIVISNKKIGLKLYGASKSNNTSCILTNNNIEMFQDHSAYSLYEGLSFQCNYGAHSKFHIQFYSAEHPSIVNCIFNGADNTAATGSGVGFGDGAGGGGGTMGIIDRCIFNHCSIDVKTWDVHITNSWIWANSRAYAVRAVGSVGNLTLVGCDILPPVVTRANRKSGIYLSGPVTQPVISSCYIDGNPTLGTGVGILAEDGVLGLTIDSLRSNENVQEVIILDSVINPVVKGGTFFKSNRAGIGAHTILLQQTKAQAMLNPCIVNNSFIQSSVVTGTLGAAVYVSAGVSRNKIKIEDNLIYQPGAGGGFLDQEITLVDGAFGDKQQGSLRGNATTRKKCSVSAAATFIGTDTFVDVPLNARGPLMYAPRIDQVRVNCSVALPYAVQVIDASSVRISFNAGGATGAFYVSVELD